MTKRERVIAAVSHRTTDRIPYQLDITDNIRPRLTEYFQDEDFLNTVVGNHLIRAKNKNHQEIGGNRYRDNWGVIWQRDESGDIGMAVDPWFPNDDFDNDFQFPEPDEALISAKCMNMLRDYPDLFHIFEVAHTLTERAWALRGMEKFLIDMAANEDFVNELLDKILEYSLGVIDIAVRYPIDCIMLGDDWGQQQGLLMGYPMWKRYIKPRMEILCRRIKEHGLLIAHHSCGDNHELFPDLIDMGLDIYNTFQPEIYDLREFKRQYGKDLTVYGGISTQGVLSQGTALEVYETTARTVEIMSADGGYIAAPTHQLMTDTPIENVLAFLDAVNGRPYREH